MQLSSSWQQSPNTFLVHRNSGSVEEIHYGLHRVPFYAFQGMFIETRFHVVPGIHESLEIGRVDWQHQLVGKDSGFVAPQNDVTEFPSIPQLIDLFDRLVSMVNGGVVHCFLHALDPNSHLWMNVLATVKRVFLLPAHTFYKREEKNYFSPWVIIHPTYLIPTTAKTFKTPFKSLQLITDNPIMLKQIQGEEIHFQCSHLITAEPSITHLQNKLSSNIKEEGEIPWKKPYY